MAWAFLIIGVMILTAAIRGRQDELWKLVKSDFTGSNNFLYWIMAIVFLVVLGNIRAIRPVSDAFLGLLILVIVIKQYKSGDLVQSFLTQIKNGTS